MPAQRVIGMHVPRMDPEEKVTGRAMYYGDLKFPKMLCGKIRRSAFAHAKILNIDTSKAERLLGSDHVITNKDVPHNKWGHSGRIGNSALLKPLLHTSLQHR